MSSGKDRSVLEYIMLLERIADAARDLARTETREVRVRLSTLLGMLDDYGRATSAPSQSSESVHFPKSGKRQPVTSAPVSR